MHGPQLFQGYWRQPAATAEVFLDHDGRPFFRTGDLGYHDEEGYFCITDCLKRMINASGFKLWPDAGRAWELASTGDHRLGTETHGDKVLRAVQLVAELPKTATGKVFWRKVQEERTAARPVREPKAPRKARCAAWGCGGWPFRAKGARVRARVTLFCLTIQSALDHPNPRSLASALLACRGAWTRVAAGHTLYRIYEPGVTQRLTLPEG